MIPPDRKIKVCLVGAGVWGRHHARVFSQRPDVQLCAVAGRTLAKTQARAAEFGLRAYTNVQDGSYGSTIRERSSREHDGHI